MHDTVGTVFPQTTGRFAAESPPPDLRRSRMEWTAAGNSLIGGPTALPRASRLVCTNTPEPCKGEVDERPAQSKGLQRRADQVQAAERRRRAANPQVRELDASDRPSVLTAWVPKSKLRAGETRPAWAVAAKPTVPRAQRLAGDDAAITFEDSSGGWHEEFVHGEDRPETTVEG